MAGRRRPVIWSPEAAADLPRFGPFTPRLPARRSRTPPSGRSPGHADCWEDHPVACRARDEVRPHLRSVVAEPYVIFYRIEDGTPQIVRVLDGRRDIDEIFAKGSEGG